MPSTSPRFAWKDRDTAVRDLLELAYRAPYFVRERALDLIGVIGSSQAVVPELVAIALDEGCPIRERRYAVKAIAAAPGDLYLPNFAQYAVLNWVAADYQLDFSDVARFSYHHPSNHDWLFRDYEKQEAGTYLRALKATAYHCDRNLHPIFVARLIDFFEENPASLDLDLARLLYMHGGSAGRDWLIPNLDTVIYLCLIGQMEYYFPLLKEWPELKIALLKNCPSLEPEIQREIRWEEAHRQFEIEQGIYYFQRPAWQQLYRLYLHAKENQAALSRLAFEATYNTRIPVRAACAFFIGLLQQRYAASTDILCHLLRQPDYWEGENSKAPVRKEAILALRNTPTPQVWEALVDGYFRNPLDHLDSTYAPVIRYVTDVLEGSQHPSVAVGDTEPTIPYSRLSAPWIDQIGGTKHFGRE